MARRLVKFSGPDLRSIKALMGYVTQLISIPQFYSFRVERKRIHYNIHCFVPNLFSYFTVVFYSLFPNITNYQLQS